MSVFLKISYFFFYFKLPWFFIKHLILRGKIKTIEIIAKKGHFKNRIKLFEVLLEDKIEIISMDMIKRYESRYLPEDLAISLTNKKRYWEEKKIADDQKQKKNAELLKNATQYKRKFSDGETFKNVKQMLRSPLNTGKWF